MQQHQRVFGEVLSHSNSGRGVVCRARGTQRAQAAVFAPDAAFLKRALLGSHLIIQMTPVANPLSTNPRPPPGLLHPLSNSLS